MKIITNNAVYVQKNDLAYLNHTNIPIPDSIFIRFLGNGVIIDDSNRYDFIKFTKQEEIEFFKNLNWIIDYNEVKDLTEEEIINTEKSIAKTKKQIADLFLSMSENNRKKNLKLITHYNLLNYKMHSLRDFLNFKQGNINIELPEDIDYPKDLKEQSNKKEIPKVLKRILLKK